jgi:hypothetical protein
MKKTLKEVIKKSELINQFYYSFTQVINKYFISDIQAIRFIFKHRLGRILDLNNPTKYNDKLQWLKLNWYDPYAKICADKYTVREVVEKEIGIDVLNELYATYYNVHDINIDELPNSFVLKVTSGSGFNIICLDKNKFNWKKEFKKIQRWMNFDYSLKGREWVYKGLNPRIVFEKYLSDEKGNPPMDYKIYCFNGAPKLIQVDIDRFGTHLQNFYDIDWNFRDVRIWCDNNKNHIISKPINLDKMIEISQTLSKPFPHVRVDLYNLNGKIIFGELTFFHLNGYAKFKDENLEIEMGNWLDLNSIDKNGRYIYEKRK